MLLRILTIKTIILAAVSLAMSNAAFAAGVSVKSAIADCEPGAAAQQPENQSRRSGETPLTVTGAVTVSPEEAKCLMSQLGKQMIVVAAVGDKTKLPGALAMPWAAGSGAEVQEMLASELATLTKGRKSTPLLVYCHHASCGLSPKVAQRMAEAGYENVFWLRSGMDGWKTAGLAFAGEVEQDPAKLFAEMVANCDARMTPKDIAYIVARTPQYKVDSDIAADLEDGRAERKSCLQAIMPKITEGKRRKADLAQRIARSDAELEKAVKSARAAFYANPAAELVPIINDESVDELRKSIEYASWARPLASRCGHFDFSVPRTNPQLEDMDRRLSSYQGCMRQLEEEIQYKKEMMRVDGFRSAVELAEHTQPYTCSATPRRTNCIPDHVWASLGGVATRAQLQRLEQAAGVFEQIPGELSRMVDQLKAHVANVEAYVDQMNAARQRNNNSYGYPSNGYASPEPVPYRRSSDTSAAGIR